MTAVGIFTFSTLTPSSPFAIAVIGYVLFGAGTGMWIPGVVMSPCGTPRQACRAPIARLCTVHATLELPSS